MIEHRDGTASHALALATGPGVKVLVIESPYYAAVTDELRAGAVSVLDAQKVGYDRVAVPGALEIPQAFQIAVAAGQFGARSRYQGVIVLGCVIRGETSHYDIVCNSTNHWLMETAIAHAIPLGNAILTVDTEAQAMARAKGGPSGKGGDAARACLRLVALAQECEKSRA